MGGISLFQLMGKLAIDGVEETTKALDNVSKDAQNLKKEFSISFQDIGKKAGELGKNMAIGLGAMATGVIAGVESTREFRQDLGKLNTTFTETGSSTETATNVFKDFYGLLGEDDTSIEAANHLAMLTNNEKHLEEYTHALTGVYANFGDSLPLEGLTEAINHTTKLGEVQGPLADALEWSGISTDSFNEKLAKLNTEEEREKLIRETLTGLYGESADTFKAMNGDIIKGNEAQADLNLKMADTMNKLEPLVTKGKEFLVEVLEKLTPAIEWVIDNINILAPIVLGFMGSLFALNIASKIMSLIPIITALNGVLMANPIALIVVAIVALIAGIVLLWNKCEWFRDLVKGLFEAIVNIVSTAIEVIKTVIMFVFNAIKTYFTTIFNIYKTIFTTAFNVIKTIIETVINVIKKVIETVFNAIKLYFTTVFNIYKTIITTAFNVIKTVIETVIKVIKTVIETVFNGIKNTISTIVNTIKNTISNVFNGVKNTISNVFNGIKNTATTVWNNIKNAITKPIEKARDVIKGIVDKIKGFFSFKVELPKIKLPHFSITPKGWSLGDLTKGKIPKLGIEWYAKGGILKRPTVFGINGDNAMVGGEAGPEAIAPISELMKYTTAAVDGSNKALEDKLDRLVGLLTNYLPALANKQVVLSTGELVGAMVDPMDKALGDLTDKRGRGY